jgi:hypothetical protein
MTAVELVVFGTIALAVWCWALAEIFRQRALWAAGAVLALVHSVAAFITFYDGSHAVARAETMRGTAALTGIEFSGGIYINYLFLAVWLTDAAWWVLRPHAYQQRPRALSFAIRGFIFFIIVNGAVVFADGWARAIGGTAVAVALLGAWHRRCASLARRSLKLPDPGAWHR